MRLVATTVVRESIRGKQRTGYIYDVDWEAGRVERRLPVPDPQFPESDDNPRGGVRGGRGVASTDAGIVVANYDTLHVYDDNWNVLKTLSHELFVGIHEVDWDGSHVWVAATAIDAVLRVTLDGSVSVGWDPHDRHRSLRLRPRPHPLDGSVDYRRRGAERIDQCHINGVTRANGTTVVNCGLVRQRKSWPVRTWRRTLRRTGWTQRHGNARRNSGSSMVVALNGSAEAEVLLELRDHDYPTHNGQLLPDGRLALNDSTENTLRIFTLEDGKRNPVAVKIPGTWLRGLEPISPTHVLVGSAPAQLVLVDVETGAIENRIALSDDPNEAVHGLTVARST